MIEKAKKQPTIIEEMIKQMKYEFDNINIILKRRRLPKFKKDYNLKYLICSFAMTELENTPPRWGQFYCKTENGLYLCNKIFIDVEKNSVLQGINENDILVQWNVFSVKNFKKSTSENYVNIYISKVKIVDDEIDFIDYNKNEMNESNLIRIAEFIYYQRKNRSVELFKLFNI